MKFQVFNTNNLSKIFLFVFVSGVCLIGFSETNGQSTRRTRSSIPQPVGTPVPSSTLIIPEIVRRADETDIENSTLTNSETQTVENTENVDVLKEKINELNAKIKTLESENKPQADAKEKKLLLSLDILSRAEQRAESLHKQLFEIIEKENAVKVRIEQIIYDMRPEMIDRSAAFAGSLRPEDVRDARRKSLESEKVNLESLMTQIQSNRAKLEQSVERADQLVEKIRLKFEKEIDDALIEEEQPQ
jgi:septal ring factor EnvC (AmiA/AmiB activator)